MATLLVAIVCVVLLERGWGRSSTSRLFLIWMAYHGFFMALPQVVIGAFVPANDVGRAMEYLVLSTDVKTTAAVLAFVAMPLLGVGLLIRDAEARGDWRNMSVARLAGAAVALLLVFQLMLRPGIRFY